jgi:hypothetical protein
MSESSNKPISMQDVATTLSGFAAQIQSPSLGTKDRHRLRSSNAKVPDALVELVCHLAEQSGGNVLGMPYDATQVRATLANVASARTAVAAAQLLLQRMDDELLQQRASVADPTFAIYTALRRLVRTPAGNALAPAYEQMKSIVKNRPVKSRKKKPAQAASGAKGNPKATPAAATESTTATTAANASPSAQTPAPKAGT